MDTTWCILMLSLVILWLLAFSTGPDSFSFSKEIKPFIVKIPPGICLLCSNNFTGAISLDLVLDTERGVQPVLCCLCRTPNILFQTRFVGVKFVRANSRLLSFWYLQRPWPHIYLWLMWNTKPSATPFSRCFVCFCMFSYGCVCCLHCMYCTIVRVCCACLRGVVFIMKSLKEADLWNVEVRSSLSGSVRASRLICPYPTKEIWVEPLRRPKLD